MKGAQDETTLYGLKKMMVLYGKDLHPNNLCEDLKSENIDIYYTCNIGNSIVLKCLGSSEYGMKSKRKLSRQKGNLVVYCKNMK